MSRPLVVHVAKTKSNYYAIISDRRWQQPYWQFHHMYKTYRDARVKADLFRSINGSALYVATEWIERPYHKPAH